MKDLARDFLICILVELLALTGLALELRAGTFIDGVQLEICAHADGIAPFTPKSSQRHLCSDCLVPVLAADPPVPSLATSAFASSLQAAARDTRIVGPATGHGAGIRGPPVTV